jgi:uncharacterized membrane protein
MNISDYIIEISVFVFFILTFITAWKDKNLPTILSAATFGILIEIMFVFIGGYHYKQFLVNIFDVPIWIGLGWAFIIYSAIETSKKIPVQPWGIPAVAGLTALTLDLGLDPIAEGLGWWHWTRGNGFLGVSYDNFVGWLLIVSAFTGFNQLFQTIWGKNNWKKWAFPFISIATSILSILCIQFGLDALYKLTSEGFIFYIVHSIFVAWVVLAATINKPIKWFQLAVPTYFHLLFFVLAVVENLTQQHSELYGIMALASSFSLAWYLIIPTPTLPSKEPSSTL